MIHAPQKGGEVAGEQEGHIFCDFREAYREETLFGFEIAELEQEGDLGRHAPHGVQQVVLRQGTGKYAARWLAEKQGRP